MAITNYGELRSAVGNWLNRSDLGSYIPDFITLASTRIYYGSRDPIFPSEPVRTKSMQAQENPSASGRTITLPTRYLSTIRLAGSTGSAAWSVDYLAPSQFAKYAHNEGYASYYTLVNNSIQLSGTTSATYTHDYYQSFAAFADNADTNALLTAAPGLWLHGALIEAWLFIRNEAEASKSHRMFTGVVSGLNNVASEYGGPLQVRAG